MRIVMREAAGKMTEVIGGGIPDPGVLMYVAAHLRLL